MPGHKAEDICITDVSIRASLEKYFEKNIVSINKFHGKKYDTIIYFEDGGSTKIQNKKIENLGGRGESFDRRHIKNTFTNQNIKKYLTLLTLIREKKNKTVMSNDQKIDFIKLCNLDLSDIKQYINKTLIGESQEANDYWCIMKTN